LKAEEYLKKQKSPQKEICQQLRVTIFKTFPGIKEEMKWGVPTYGEGTFYLAALKDHVNLGFSMANLTKEEQRHFRGSGKTMRAIMIKSIDEIDEQGIVELLRLVWKKRDIKPAS
jgi:hypothetical protein